MGRNPWPGRHPSGGVDRWGCSGKKRYVWVRLLPYPLDGVTRRKDGARGPVRWRSGCNKPESLENSPIPRPDPLGRSFGGVATVCGPEDIGVVRTPQSEHRTGGVVRSGRRVRS